MHCDEGKQRYFLGLIRNSPCLQMLKGKLRDGAGVAEENSEILFKSPDCIAW